MEIGVIVVIIAIFAVINKHKKTKNKIVVEQKTIIKENMLFSGYPTMVISGMFLIICIPTPMAAVYDFIMYQDPEAISALLMTSLIGFGAYMNLKKTYHYYKSVKNKEYHIIKTILTEKSSDEDGYYFTFQDYPNYMTVGRNEYVTNQEGQEFYIFIFGNNVNAKCFSCKYYELEDTSMLVEVSK